jgi:hypothetical protein
MLGLSAMENRQISAPAGNWIQALALTSGDVDLSLLIHSAYSVKEVVSSYVKTNLNSVALVRKLTISTERPQQVGEGCGVVSAMDPHGR